MFPITLNFCSLYFAPATTAFASNSFIKSLLSTNGSDDSTFTAVAIAGAFSTVTACFGVSFGAATAIQASYIDDNIISCIALDAWTLPIPSKTINENINTHLLHIGQKSEKYWKDKDNKLKLDTLCSNNQKESIQVMIPNTKHFDYSDFSHFTWATRLFGISGRIKRQNFRSSLNKVILNYFNFHMLNMDVLSVKEIKDYDQNIVIISNKTKEQ